MCTSVTLCSIVPGGLFLYSLEPAVQRQQSLSLSLSLLDLICKQQKRIKSDRREQNKIQYQIEQNKSVTNIISKQQKRIKLTLKTTKAHQIFMLKTAKAHHI